MKIIFALSSIFLISKVSLSCKLETDGCSSPIQNAPFIKLFTPACVRHDICYRCGYKYGWSKNSCDQAFSKDMLTLCKRNGRSHACKTASYFYRKAVLVAGHFFYRRPSAEFCNDRCVIQHGHPNIGV